MMIIIGYLYYYRLLQELKEIIRIYVDHLVILHSPYYLSTDKSIPILIITNFPIKITTINFIANCE